VAVFAVALAVSAQDWGQWGRNSQHTGAVSVAGQPALHVLEDIVYDPFVEQEREDPLSGDGLSIHYQAPLLDGDDVYMEFKTGTYTTLDHWETQTWNEKKLSWDHGHLATRWSFESDWKPVPYSPIAPTGPLWEPVFHAALTSSAVYVPGAGGTIFKLSRQSGAVLARINPFGSTIDPHTFSIGPLTVDSSGNIYYNVLQLDPADAWSNDVVNSWLVKVSSTGAASKATYASLNPNAPAAQGSHCLGIFNLNQLPWPPGKNSSPPSIPCGSQRPALNHAPAVAPNGTIYVVTGAQFTDRTGFLLAVNPNLTPKWAASLRDRLNTGCNVLLPPNGTPGGCSTEGTTGYDPAQNRPGAGRVIDDSTASPVVLPDGSVLYGTYTRYNYAQGHLMKFSSSGQFLAAFPFGWDTTPSVYQHGGTYSIILKENHYNGLGTYCNDPVICPPDRNTNNPSYPEQYFITQLSKNLTPEWKWQNTNTLNCSTDEQGNVTCTDDHPFGFEWCVNAGVVDGGGVFYANSEDGNLYVIQQGGTLREKLFLETAIGAAYTPLTIDRNGRVYSQNFGHLFVVGR
jgi:hypothetical protein